MNNYDTGAEGQFCYEETEELPGAPIRIHERSTTLSSALKAGWSCCAFGLAVAWVFPPGYFFFFAALIVAIVTMRTRELNKGVVLLLSSFVGVSISVAISLVLTVGVFAHELVPASAQAQQDAQKMREAELQLITAQQNARALINRDPATPKPYTSTTPRRSPQILSLTR